jgi:hypothetical protein
MITEHVWDIHHDTMSNVVDVHINALRKQDRQRILAGLDSDDSRRWLYAHEPNTVNARGLRLKLTLLYTAILAVVLAGLFAIAYYVLANQIDATATDELVERATALKGYLHFENNRPILTFDANDPEVAFFVRTATRYYQIYDFATAEILEQSPDMAFLGLQFTPNELHALTEFPILSDIQTDQGKIRLFSDRITSDYGAAT